MHTRRIYKAAVGANVGFDEERRLALSALPHIRFLFVASHLLSWASFRPGLTAKPLPAHRGFIRSLHRRGLAPPFPPACQAYILRLRWLVNLAGLRSG